MEMTTNAGVAAALVGATLTRLHYIRSQSSSQVARRWKKERQTGPTRVPLPADPHALARMIQLHKDMTAYAASGRPFAASVHEALKATEGAVRMYGCNGLAVSFNGGKDSTVVLYLVAAVVAGLRAQGEELPGVVQAVYFHDPDSCFDGMLKFIRDAAAFCGVELVQFPPTTSIKAALARMRSDMGMRAVAVGTRSSDPNSRGQGMFAPSDICNGWPAFMRVNPVIYWSYGAIWGLLRNFNLPYFSMYDCGYTSLGRVATTAPNPALLIRAASAEPGSTAEYKPAYMLTDAQAGSERAARNPAAASWRPTPARPVNLKMGGTEKPSSPEAAKAEAKAVAEARAKTIAGLRSPTTQVPAGRYLKQAAFVAIGDEVLTGKVVDRNTPTVIHLFRKYGLVLARVAVVPDNVDAISSTIKSIARQPNIDVVFTSGGVGPTHDDVTMASMAKAFGCRLEVRDAYKNGIRRTIESRHLPRLMAAFETNQGRAPGPAEVKKMRLALASEGGDTRMGEVAMTKLSKIPTLADTVHLDEFDPQITWPAVVCQKAGTCPVWVLPGVPKEFESKLRAILVRNKLGASTKSGTFSSTAKKLTCQVLLRVENELLYAESLKMLATKFPAVSFGSYPYLEGKGGEKERRDKAKTVIVVEGFDDCEKEITASLKKLLGVLRDLEKTCRTKILCGGYPVVRGSMIEDTANPEESDGEGDANEFEVIDVKSLMELDTPVLVALDRSSPGLLEHARAQQS